MALGTDAGPQVYTATISGALDIGGTTADVAQFEARDDRRIVGVVLSVNGDQAFLEISESSTPNLNVGAESDRSGTIAMGHDQALFFEEQLWIEWSENQELHVHEKNNTGAAVSYTATIYYVEEADC